MRCFEPRRVASVLVRLLVLHGNAVALVFVATASAFPVAFPSIGLPLHLVKQLPLDFDTVKHLLRQPRGIVQGDKKLCAPGHASSVTPARSCRA